MDRAAETDVDKVIKGGFCVGCGLCEYIAPTDFKVLKNEFGQNQAVRIRPSSSEVVNQVCPFTNHCKHEDQIAAMRFKDSTGYTSEFGYYEACYAAYVKEGNYRNNGSSGGVSTWICAELLDKGIVDVVVSVGPVSGTYTFQYSTSRNKDQVETKSKSRYYPVVLGKELEMAFESERVAIVGLPCFIKGIRRLSLTNEKINKKIVFAISLVCGHLKSSTFGQLLGWQLGIHPSELVDINYRLKLSGRPASRYGVSVIARNGIHIESPMENLIGANWGHGILKLESCDYCDDVFGETADMSIGDAWLPQFEKDSNGTNLLVIRNKVLHELFETALVQNRLHLTTLTEKQVVASQAGGLRHRREGLSYRLALKHESGEWYPRKRVEPSKNHLTKKTKRIQDVRIKIRHSSHELFKKALQQNNLKVFTDGMKHLLSELDALQQQPRHKRALDFLKRNIKRVLNFKLT